MRPLVAIPGLIDAAYAHDVCLGSGVGHAALEPASAGSCATVTMAEANARKTLDTGVTTVRDLGASRGTDYAMRDAINAGRMTVLACSSPDRGSGGVGTAGLAPRPWRRWSTRESRPAPLDQGVCVARSYQSCRHHADAHLRGTEGPSSTPRMRRATPVAVHSYGASGVRDAVRAGADSIEHGHRHRRRDVCRDEEAGHGLGADRGSQPLLRGRQG
jgi:hypothetical protein